MKVWIVEHHYMDDLDCDGSEIVGVYNSFEKAKEYIDSVAPDEVNLSRKEKTIYYVKARTDECVENSDGEPYVWCTTWNRYYVRIEGTEVQ